MKASTIFLTILLGALLVSGCSGLPDFVRNFQDAERITPSDVIIAEEREVSGFNAIDMRSFGRVVLTQGETESLTIEGSDNLVPLVRTSVNGSKLIIEMEENINVVDWNNKENVLTFKITVRDLTDLTLSGLADVQMETLSTTDLGVTMSGAGQLILGDLAAENLDVIVSGLGSVEIAGQVTDVGIEIPGAGSVNAGELECQTATVDISGLGSATVWVTGELKGTISGSGSVSYYGDPQTSVNTTGLGSYKAMGDK